MKKLNQNKHYFWNIFKMIVQLTIGYLLMSSSDIVAGEISVCMPAEANDIDFICGQYIVPMKIPKACKSFKLQRGEMNTNTMLLLLGEYHGRRQETVKCVNALTENHKKHLVLVEGETAGVPSPCRMAHLQSRTGRTCLGWDNRAAMKMLSEAIDDSAVLICVSSLKTFFNKNPSDSLFDAFLENIINNPPSKIMSDQQRADCMLKAATWLLAQRKKSLPYQEIFVKAKEHTLTFTPERIFKYKQANTIRFSSLIKTISNIPSDTFAVVIIGKNHLIQRDETDLANAKEFSDNLNKGKIQQNFAVLTM